MVELTDEEVLDELEALNNLTSPFDAAGMALLAKSQKFLLAMMDPAIAARAARAGYNGRQHAAGWEYLNGATGAKRPFTHYLSEAEQQLLSQDDKSKPVIIALDTFENTWFPLIRPTIRRYIAAEKAEAVEVAFFTGLQQQPEGPLVVNSVALLLERIDGLKSSDVPGAADAYQALVEKGLTEEEVTRVKKLLEQAKEAVKIAAPRVSEQEQRAATEAQLKAFNQLKLWYIDWATTLRPKVGYHDGLKLGIRAGKGGPKKDKNGGNG